MGSALVLLLGACAGPSGGSPADAAPARPDQAMLDVPTRLKARTARLVVSSHWRDQAILEGIHVDRGDGSQWVAEGDAKLVLRGIEAHCRERVSITFLDDHEHLVLYATDVELLERKKGYVHRHADVPAITIADDKLSVFTR